MIVDPEVVMLPDELGIEDEPTPELLESLAASTRKTRAAHDGGPQAADQLAAALVREALRLRNSRQ